MQGWPSPASRAVITITVQRRAGTSHAPYPQPDSDSATALGKYFGSDPNYFKLEANYLNSNPN